MFNRETLARGLVIGVVALGTVACGSSKTSGDVSKAKAAITPAQEAKAKQIADQCLKKGGGFKAEYKCAVPPGHGVAFVRCVLDGIPKNKSQAAIESVLINCGERYR